MGLLALAHTAKTARKPHEFERLTFKQFSFVEYVCKQYVIHETSRMLDKNSPKDIGNQICPGFISTEIFSRQLCVLPFAEDPKGPTGQSLPADNTDTNKLYEKANIS